MRDFLLERNLLTAAKPNLQRHHLNPPTAAHTKRTALDIFSIQISLIFWEALDRQGLIPRWELGAPFLDPPLPPVESVHERVDDDCAALAIRA